ncbi:hypothetical protein NC77_14265 [Janthinobacterium lividum]|nr:hypothetical protein NC77_14265 [Janthinobacterium lividum]
MCPTVLATEGQAEELTGIFYFEFRVVASRECLLELNRTLSFQTKNTLESHLRKNFSKWIVRIDDSR